MGIVSPKLYAERQGNAWVRALRREELRQSDDQCGEPLSKLQEDPSIIFKGGRGGLRVRVMPPMIGTELGRTRSTPRLGSSKEHLRGKKSTSRAAAEMSALTVSIYLSEDRKLVGPKQNWCFSLFSSSSGVPLYSCCPPNCNWKKDRCGPLCILPNHSTEFLKCRWYLFVFYQLFSQECYAPCCQSQWHATPRTYAHRSECHIGQAFCVPHPEVPLWPSQICSPAVSETTHS